MLTIPEAAKIHEAASWLAGQDPAPSPFIPIVCKRFGLSPKEAIDAVREASLQKGSAP